MDIPKFEDVAENKALDGDKVRIDDVLNSEIIVTGFHVSSSKYQNKGCSFCTKIQFYFANDEKQEKKVFFSGSSVIKDQAEEMEKKLQEKGMEYIFKTTVKKVGNYYSFT
jgi:hypothetical protein